MCTRENTFLQQGEHIFYNQTHTNTHSHIPTGFQGPGMCECVWKSVLDVFTLPRYLPRTEGTSDSCVGRVFVCAFSLPPPISLPLPFPHHYLSHAHAPGVLQTRTHACRHAHARTRTHTHAHARTRTHTHARTHTERIWGTPAVDDAQLLCCTRHYLWQKFSKVLNPKP